MFAAGSVISMLLVAVAGAVLCLFIARPREVLSTILTVPMIESLFAANLWVAVLAGGFVSAAEQWFYIDAFSAFHVVVLVLVFLLSSAFAGVYFTNDVDDHSFTPAVAR